MIDDSGAVLASDIVAGSVPGPVPMLLLQ